ncbi:hypothetical protein ACFWY9_03815 [Amycolatopsis sp. NPDC059027]|uniref:hypothetical protein n=1 Tax=Amycolatopsis sp. NPDC059027 TaxID=3346709 RepID=UPI00366EF9D0
MKQIGRPSPADDFTRTTSVRPAQLTGSATAVTADTLSPARTHPIATPNRDARSTRAKATAEQQDVREQVAQLAAGGGPQVCERATTVLGGSATDIRTRAQAAEQTQIAKDTSARAVTLALHAKREADRAAWATDQHNYIIRLSRCLRRERARMGSAQAIIMF